MTMAGRILGAIALLAAVAARADVRAVLHEPRDGQVLRGGTQATISWSAPELPAFAEEWEAFLSVDGGNYYGYRITPHLDLAERPFSFEVPNVATEHARILIRAGDEDREIEIELAQTFVIEQDHARALAAPHLEVEEDERGEPAREGDRGVIDWIDGDRSGRNLTEQRALRPRPVLCSAPSIERITESAEDPGVRSVPGSGETPSRLAVPASRPCLRVARRHRSGRDVLLTHRRLNI